MSLFQNILAKALEVLGEMKIESLLTGGIAVNYYGFSRTTFDIDFMMVVPDADGLVWAMRKAGFSSYSVQGNVMFFRNPEDPIRVDFIRIDTGTLAKLMQSAVPVNLHGCQVMIPSLNDLLAMKFHSFNQSPLRGKDLEDIVWLSIFNEVDMDAVLRPLALKYASDEIYRQVCELIQTQKNNLLSDHV